MVTAVRSTYALVCSTCAYLSNLYMDSLHLHGLSVGWLAGWLACWWGAPSTPMSRYSSFNKTHATHERPPHAWCALWHHARQKTTPEEMYSAKILTAVVDAMALLSHGKIMGVVFTRALCTSEPLLLFSKSICKPRADTYVTRQVRK